MARNDGVDRTIVRNHDLKTPEDVAKIQEHNERQKDMCWCSNCPGLAGMLPMC